MSDIDVYQQNLRPFRSLENLVEISFKKCVFLHFVNNKCIIFYFLGKDHYHKKNENILQVGIILFFHFSFVW
jgi:hypothetical protein